jgi:hypothetical protein
MSIITLSTMIFGAVTNLAKMGETLKSVGTAEKIQKIVTDHWFATTLALFVIGYHVWRYFADRKWKEA